MERIADGGTSIGARYFLQSLYYYVDDERAIIFKSNGIIYTTKTILTATHLFYFFLQHECSLSARY